MNDIKVIDKQIAITPDQMLMKGIESGLDIDKLEKLMALQERWEAKNAERAFYDAMSSFQENKPDIIKTKKGHNSNYAPLAKIQKAIDPIATRFGLSYRFEQKMKDGKMIVACVVTHKGGHSERSEMEAPADTSGSKNAIQSWGSTRSYLYRYTLEGVFGLSSDDDDDGNKASKPIELPFLQPNTEAWGKALIALKGIYKIDDIKKKFKITKENEDKLMNETLL